MFLDDPGAVLYSLQDESNPWQQGGGGIVQALDKQPQEQSPPATAPIAPPIHSVFVAVAGVAAGRGLIVTAATIQFLDHGSWSLEEEETGRASDRYDSNR